MKRFFYHGTSADNLQSILKHGISASETKIWNCSADEVYLWCPEAIAEANDEKDESAELKEERAFYKACESAQFAAITSKDCRLIVIKVELDDEEISPDLSAENMEAQGAVCIYRDILPSEIVEIKVSNDLSLIRGYFIGMMLDNEYCGLEFTKTEEKIGKAMREVIYIDDVDDLIEWETINELEPA